MMCAHEQCGLIEWRIFFDSTSTAWTPVAQFHSAKHEHFDFQLRFRRLLSRSNVFFNDGAEPVGSVRKSSCLA